MRMFAIFLGCMSVLLFAHTEPSQTVEADAEQCEAIDVDEAVFFVSNDDLYFDNDQIVAVVGEQAYPVRAMQRNGNQWRVQVVSYGYCPNGHNLCECGFCHLWPKCRYSVRLCKKWDK